MHQISMFFRGLVTTILLLPVLKSHGETEIERPSQPDSLGDVSCQNLAPLYAPGVKDSDTFRIFSDETQEYFYVDRANLIRDISYCSDPRDMATYDPRLLKELRQQMNETRIPSIAEFLMKTYAAVSDFLDKPQIYSKNRAHYIRMIEAIDYRFLLHAFIVSLALTLLRKIVNWSVIRPLALKMKLNAIDSQKLITSSWYCTAYVCLWLITVKVVFLSGRDDFFKPLAIFSKVKIDLGFFYMPIASDIYFLYVAQLGFYIHGLIGLISAEDKWREDRLVFCLHHLITIALIAFSYFCRFHLVGTLVLLLHDVNDIFLECGKTVVYTKFRNKHYHKSHDTVGTFCYVMFVLSWIVTRLYWLPFKVLYATGWGAYITHIGKEMFFFIEFNVLLWALFVLHIYWSYLIGVLAYKMMSGQMKNLSDIRETDVDYTVDPVELAKLVVSDKLKQQ